MRRPSLVVQVPGVIQRGLKVGGRHAGLTPAASRAVLTCLASCLPGPLCLQGLKLDTDIAALMDAEEQEEAAAAAGAGVDASTASTPQAQERQQAEEQGGAQQAQLDGMQQAEQAQQQQEDEDGPESMVDFLLRRQLSPASPAEHAATSSAGSAGPTAGAAGMPDVPPPAAWNTVGPLCCWHPVGSGEAAVAHIAKRLATMEVCGTWPGLRVHLLVRVQSALALLVAQGGAAQDGLLE